MMSPEAPEYSRSSVVLTPFKKMPNATAGYRHDACSGPESSFSRHTSNPKMNRRIFLKHSTLASIALTAPSARTFAQTRKKPQPKAPPLPLAGTTPPVLQNASETAVTVFWTTSGPATGWVEYGESPSLGYVARGEVEGLLPYDHRVLRVRLTGLTPGRTYHYRVQTAAFDFSHPYSVGRGAAQPGPLYSFTTLNRAAATTSFIVWNDTHQNKDTLARLIGHLPNHPADFLVWNGDMFNFIMSEETLIQESLHPAGLEYAATRPLVFSRGNHDVRGSVARMLGRTLEPPAGKYYHRFQQGPAACLVLDTGEDKPDNDPEYGGLVDFASYRSTQREWLAANVAQPEFQLAPFRILFTHIPLRGRGASADSREKWESLLRAGRVDFAISGHTHQHAYHEPTPEQPWPLLVGGGPAATNATFIHARVTAERLYIRLFNLEGKNLGQWEISRRV